MHEYNQSVNHQPINQLISRSNNPSINWTIVLSNVRKPKHATKQATKYKISHLTVHCDESSHQKKNHQQTWMRPKRKHAATKLCGTQSQAQYRTDKTTPDNAKFRKLAHAFLLPFTCFSIEPNKDLCSFSAGSHFLSRYNWQSLLRAAISVVRCVVALEHDDEFRPIIYP